MTSEKFKAFIENHGITFDENDQVIHRDRYELYDRIEAQDLIIYDLRMKLLELSPPPFKFGR